MGSIIPRTLKKTEEGNQLKKEKTELLLLRKLQLKCSICLNNTSNINLTRFNLEILKISVLYNHQKRKGIRLDYKLTNT